jgi:hypothetical protein
MNDVTQLLAVFRRPGDVRRGVGPGWLSANGRAALWLRPRGLAWVPVVLTSTAASPAVASTLALPPVVRALWKPLSPTALLELVRSELGTERQGPRTEGRKRTSPHFCS